MIHYYGYLFVKKKVFNYSDFHFSKVTSYKIHTLVTKYLFTIAHLISKFGFKVIEDFTEPIYNLTLLR